MFTVKNIAKRIHGIRKLFFPIPILLPPSQIKLACANAHPKGMRLPVQKIVCSRMALACVELSMDRTLSTNNGAD